MRALGFLKLGSSFSWSPISDPISEVETDFCLRPDLDLELALLLALELLGVLETLGVLRACNNSNLDWS